MRKIASAGFSETAIGKFVQSNLGLLSEFVIAPNAGCARSVR